MNFKKIIFVILFLTLILTLVTFSDIKAQKLTTSIKAVLVKSENYKKFHGSVVSQFTTDLSFQSEGRINYIPYSKGDYVRKGQVLARLDGILYKIRRNEEQARLQENQIQYNKAKSYFKRMDILHKEGAISDNDWEEAYFNLKTTGENIKIQKEKLNYLNKEISYNMITAPYDGYIFEKYAQVGAYAKVGEKIITIIGTDKTQVEVMVDSDTINLINVNKIVTVEHNDNKYQGKIKHISKSSINAGGYLVKIELDNLEPQLKDGMGIDALIPLNNDSVSLIPLSSIFESENAKYVYKIINVKNDIGEVKKEKVETGDILESEIEILKGLNKDDLVVIDGLEKIKSNSKIKIEILK